MQQSSLPVLTEATRDVVFGQLVARHREDGPGVPYFDQFAQVKIGSALGYARRLLHRVRHDRYRYFSFNS